MAWLTGIGIAQHAARAGFRDEDLVISVAVALGSSLGNAGQNGGLWNMTGAPANDPAGQAQAAFARWSAGGWERFNVYTSKRYLIFMPGAAAAAAAREVLEIIEGAGKAAEGAIDAGESMIEAAQNAVSLGVKAGAWLSKRENWIRIAQVVVGGSMVIVALTMITRPDQKLAGAAGTLVRPIVKGVTGGGGKG